MNGKGMQAACWEKAKQTFVSVFTLFALVTLLLVSGQNSFAQRLDEDIFIDDTARLDARDLFLLSNEWRVGSATEPTTNDFTGDGTFNALDLLIFSESFHFEFQQPTPTPTPTVGDATPTPTATVAPATPTATNTPIVEPPTPTPTNTLEPSPTPTPTNTPTLTNTPEPTATPTPTFTPGPGDFEPFEQNFDELEAVANDIDDVTDDVFTFTNGDTADLQNQDRVAPNTFEVFPWVIVDTSANQAGDRGIAESAPKSITFNNDPDLFFYENDQASILQIDKTFNTSRAVAPRIAFDIAFVLDDPVGIAGDYITVEVKRQDSDTWELIDLNGDGEVVSDVGLKAANTDSALGFQSEGAFDALYDSSTPGKDKFEDITTEDFIHIEAVLPQDAGLLVSIRFQSDGSQSFFEGGYLDNLQIFDAASGGGDPVIAQVSSRAGDELFADTENPILIEGQALGGASSVNFNVGDTSTEITEIQVVNGAVQATLPRPADIAIDVTASLVVNLADGRTTAPFEVVLNAAPAPEITGLNPEQFFIESSDAELTITGNHFRPLLEDASRENGSTVIITQGTAELTIPASDLLSVNGNALVADISGLQDAGFRAEDFAEVRVRNELSGLESNTFFISLFGGSGAVSVDNFIISVGNPDDFTNGFTYNPDSQNFPLQTDHAITFGFDGSGFSPGSLNFSVEGKDIITGSQAAAGIAEPTRVDVFETQNSITVFLAPNIIEATGTVTASIQFGNGEPVLREFDILAPLPPVLYERPADDIDSNPDWTNDGQPFSSSEPVQMRIVGDNFRGYGPSGVELDGFTQFFLLPVDGSEPVALPEVDPFSFPIIPPEIGDALLTQDEIFLDIEPETVPPGEYRLRAVNPDSGLSIESAGNRTVTFE